MPITAKFSKKFYDTLGHDIADEMVDWFNRADETYRTDLYRINDLNFARFEAKVDQRFAESEAKSQVRLAELDAANMPADIDALSPSTPTDITIDITDISVDD